jgi:hypothetical protein
MVPESKAGLAQYIPIAFSVLELCHEIEKLPASEQQTKISVMAGEIYQRLKAAENA